MVVKLRSTIYLLILGLIACPSIYAAEGGFVFSGQQQSAGYATASYYDSVSQYDIKAPRPKNATSKPDAHVSVPPQPEKKKQAAKTTSAGTVEIASKPKPKSFKLASTKSTQPSKTIQASKTIPVENTIGDGCEADCYQDDCCDLGCSDGCCANYECCGEKDFFRSGNFYIRGWIDQGMTFNHKSPSNRQNGPTGYNWRSNDYMMNQLYTVIGRDVTANGCYWDAGGRVDALYGTDYRYVEAWGLETRKTGNDRARWNANNSFGEKGMYGFALPQLYAEFAVPLAQGTTFKFGHFYSLIGYESPMAPQNFFYSHSYARVYGEPTTETGMLASSKISPNVVVHGGFSQGWDIWESPIQALSFIGGVCWTSYDKRTSIGFAIDTGHFPVEIDPAVGDDRTVCSLVISQQFGSRWTYIFQYDFGSQQSAFVDLQDQPQTANWYGINNYLFYSLSDTLAAGMRVEWFCDADRFMVIENPLAPWSGKDYCELTLGLNWQPNDCVVIRPEFRWDWSNVQGGSFRPYNNFTSSHQFLFAADMIIRF